MLLSFLSKTVFSLLDLGFEHAFISTLMLSMLVIGYKYTYALYFHPLCKFPGPFWGSVTDFYKTYLFSTREFHIRLLSLHRNYGTGPPNSQNSKAEADDVTLLGTSVRLAPNLLSISDPFLLPEIYHRHVDKTPFYSTGLAGEVPPLLQLQGDQEHAAKLKPLAAPVGTYLSPG